MLAMFKKEMRSYFRSMTGFVFVALFLVVLGLYTSVFCFKNGTPQYEGVFYSCSFIFLITVPVLTMRSFADERRQKTDQLLYSLPVSTAQIVVGKYLAMLCVFAIPVLVSCLYPFVIRLYDPSGYMSYAAIYSAIFAFFCLGAALLSVGMFMSSLTENVFISAILTFITLLICFLMGAISDIMSGSSDAASVVYAIFVLLISLLVFFVTKSKTAGWTVFMALEIPIVIISLVKPELFEGLLPKTFDVLSMFDRLDPFKNAVFDLKVILYYLSIAVVFNVFTVQSMEKRRWS